MVDWQTEVSLCLEFETLDRPLSKSKLGFNIQLKRCTHITSLRFWRQGYFGSFLQKARSMRTWNRPARHWQCTVTSAGAACIVRTSYRMPPWVESPAESTTSNLLARSAIKTANAPWRPRRKMSKKKLVQHQTHASSPTLVARLSC